MEAMQQKKQALKKAIGAFAILLTLPIFITACGSGGSANSSKPKVADDMVKYPEKAEMRLLTDRPPQLETPLRVFKEDFTPNEYFFVRWHMAQLVTKIDIDTFRLYIGGAVNKALALSMNDLKTKFPADSIVAVAICAGNSRSTFEPQVPGSQWRNGGMGNAKWKGVKLKDILLMAGVKEGAVDVTFQGMDRGALPAIPAFIKSLGIQHATDGEVMIAYEMNGAPIPMLNGYPLKLVVPGWYATYWVGALNSINVLTEKYTGFWMEKAYLVPPNTEINESPASPAQARVPISNIKMHSIFVAPEPGDAVSVNKPCPVEGLVFTDGTPVQKVEISADNGKTWAPAKLNPGLGKYSWRRWKYDWVPQATGINHLKVRATDSAGHTQPEQQWNKSGYARGFIEHLEIDVK